jgi:hypothetical protein
VLQYFLNRRCALQARSHIQCSWAGPIQQSSQTSPSAMYLYLWHALKQYFWTAKSISHLLSLPSRQNWLLSKEKNGPEPLIWNWGSCQSQGKNYCKMERTLVLHLQVCYLSPSVFATLKKLSSVVDWQHTLNHDHKLLEGKLCFKKMWNYF